MSWKEVGLGVIESKIQAAINPGDHLIVEYGEITDVIPKAEWEERAANLAILKPRIAKAMEETRRIGF